MKKTYFAPTSTVVLIMSQPILQPVSSLEGQEGNSTVNVTPSEEEYDGEGCSRRGGVWDDEF